MIRVLVNNAVADIHCSKPGCYICKIVTYGLPDDDFTKIVETRELIGNELEVNITTYRKMPKHLPIKVSFFA